MFILHTFLPQITSTQSWEVPVGNITIFQLDLSSTSSWVDPGSDLNMFPTKPSKTIGLPGKPEGNVVHRVQNAVSLEIVFMRDYNTQVFIV